MLAAALSALAGLFKIVLGFMSAAHERLLISLGASQEHSRNVQASADAEAAIKEVADDRSSIPDAATDPDDLARELRKQSTADSVRSGRRRPF